MIWNMVDVKGDWYGNMRDMSGSLYLIAGYVMASSAENTGAPDILSGSK
jgi:hypothetical protein